MHAGRQAGRKAGIPNEYRTNSKRIPNASRPKMRAPVSTCSAVQYRTTYPGTTEAGRKQASRTNLERIPNASRPKMRASVSTCSAVQYSTHTQRWYTDVRQQRTACMQGGRQEGRHPERIPNESQTNPERIPSEIEGSRIYM